MSRQPRTLQCGVHDGGGHGGGGHGGGGGDASPSRGRVRRSGGDDVIDGLDRPPHLNYCSLPQPLLGERGARARARGARAHDEKMN